MPRTRNPRTLPAPVLGLFIALIAANPLAGQEAHSAQRMPNTLTAQERQEGWALLFDGRTTSGWRGFRQDRMPGGWAVVDGALTRIAGGGDIVTTEQFGDFELALEWKVSPRGNSGIFYRATEDVERIYFAAPEYQILDDARHPDGQSALTSAAALYGLYAPRPKATRPAGEWNEARVVARGPRVEHWLNGVMVVEYDASSDDFAKRVAASKFAEWPPFAKSLRGHIGLQDHGDWIAYRNIRIRVLQ
jgi:hypothetical protein